MNITCGTDIIEIARIKESIERSGETFLNEVFTQNEIHYCKSKRSAMYQHFAARFAAKEAIFKAISYLLDNRFEISWKNAEISNNDMGKPIVKFINTGLDKIDIDLSISHCKDYAVAMVIVKYEGEV